MRTPPPNLHPAELHGLVDGVIGRHQAQRVLTFLQHNPADAARVESWRRQNAALRAHFNPIADEALPLSLSLIYAAEPRDMARVPAPLPRTDEPIRQLQQAARQKRRKQRHVMGPAIAAFILGVGVSAAGSMYLARNMKSGTAPVRVSYADVTGSIASPMERVQQRAALAHQTHVLDARHAVEISGESRPNLQRYFSERLSFAAAVPDLSADGLTLLGGRVVIGEWGPAALLVFASATGERFSLYSEKRVGADASGSQEIAPAGFKGTIWNGTSAVHVFLGPMNATLPLKPLR